MPLTINFYPVERTLHYIRKLFNQILIQYLKLTSRHHQPEVLYKSNNYIIVNKPFDVKINSQDSRDYTVADNLKTAFPELHDQSCVHHFRYYKLYCEYWRLYNGMPLSLPVDTSFILLITWTLGGEFCLFTARFQITKGMLVIFLGYMIQTLAFWN